jgi:hypothetical protein
MSLLAWPHRRDVLHNGVDDRHSIQFDARPVLVDHGKLHQDAQAGTSEKNTTRHRSADETNPHLVKTLEHISFLFDVQEQASGLMCRAIVVSPTDL